MKEKKEWEKKIEKELLLSINLSKCVHFSKWFELSNRRTRRDLIDKPIEFWSIVWWIPSDDAK